METKNKSVWARTKESQRMKLTSQQLATDNQDTTKITVTKVTPQRSRTPEHTVNSRLEPGLLVKSGRHNRPV